MGLGGTNRACGGGGDRIDRASHTIATAPLATNTSKKTAASEPRTIHNFIRDRGSGRRIFRNRAASASDMVAGDRGEDRAASTSATMTSRSPSSGGAGRRKHSSHLGQRSRALAGVSSLRRRTALQAGQGKCVNGMVPSPSKLDEEGITAAAHFLPSSQGVKRRQRFRFIAWDAIRDKKERDTGVAPVLLPWEGSAQLLGQSRDTEDSIRSQQRSARGVAHFTPASTASRRPRGSPGR